MSPEKGGSISYKIVTRYQFLEDLAQSMTKPEAFLRKKRHIAVITKTGSISRKKHFDMFEGSHYETKLNKRCLFLMDLGSKCLYW